MSRSTADVLLRLRRQSSATDALRAMVSISVAAQEGDERLLAEAKRHLRGRVTLRELERLLDLS
jgi:hypothetical protein